MRDLTLSLTQALPKKRSHTTSNTVLHFNLAILVLIVTTGFVYLFQINALGTRGYEIRQLEQQIKTLEKDNKQLQVQSSNLKSITRIEEQAQALNMVPVSNVKYIKDADFALR